MQQLLPAIEPFRTGTLRASDLHTIHYEEVGNPTGVPVVFLHGGPGAGIVPIYRRIFDPRVWRVVLPDQRGAGRSTPNAELRENTTWHLVADLEALREHLCIERWAVVGGSWGATLALAYAQAHPSSVTGLILRGTWLARRQDIHWQFHRLGGAASLFPHEYARFAAFIPPPEQSDLVGAYYRRLMSGDPETSQQAAKHKAAWEGCKISLHPAQDMAGTSEAALIGDYLALARLEISYTHHQVWLAQDNQLLDNMPRIAHLPGTIICGRYDAITPPAASVALADRWPRAELQIVEATGHAFFEPGIIDAHVRAVSSLATAITAS